MDTLQLESIAAMLGVVGRLHREPPGDLELSMLRDLVDQWPLDAAPDSDAGLDAWRASAEAGEDAAQIRADHDRLYGVAARAVVPPYESVQREQERLTFGEATHRVRDAYARLGLQAPELNREPDDHIGLELAFVGELAAAGLEAIEAGDAAALASATGGARRFVDEHLLAWGPGFARLVAEGADTDLYRAVGHLLTGALPQLDGLLAEG